MSLAAFTMLSVAATLGAALLTPALPLRGHFRRSRLAVVHGAFGAAALALTTWALNVAPKVSPVIWSGYALVAVGFCLGLAVWAMSRSGRRTPHFIVPLHVVFAGIGYLVLAGLVLRS